MQRQVAACLEQSQMIFRTAESKNDLVRSWNRPDRPFFAAGACHILAAVFLESYTDSGYTPFLVLPDSGFRGVHIFVSNKTLVFDYHGFVEKDRYLSHFREKINRLFPGWRGRIEEISGSPIDVSFCRETGHRLLQQFLHDPRKRAFSYLKRFPFPSFPSLPPSAGAWKRGIKK